MRIAYLMSMLTQSFEAEQIADELKKSGLDLKALGQKYAILCRKDMLDRSLSQVGDLGGFRAQ